MSESSLRASAINPVNWFLDRKRKIRTLRNTHLHLPCPSSLFLGHSPFPFLGLPSLSTQPLSPNPFLTPDPKVWLQSHPACSIVSEVYYVVYLRMPITKSSFAHYGLCLLVLLEFTFVSVRHFVVPLSALKTESSSLLPTHQRVTYTQIKAVEKKLELSSKTYFKNWGANLAFLSQNGSYSLAYDSSLQLAWSSSCEQEHCRKLLHLLFRNLRV